MLLIGEYLVDKRMKGKIPYNKMYVGRYLTPSRTTNFYLSFINCRITSVYCFYNVNVCAKYINSDFIK